jgi:hypothetical protein
VRRLAFGEDSGDEDIDVVLRLMDLHRDLITVMFHPTTRLPHYRCVSRRFV